MSTSSLDDILIDNITGTNRADPPSASEEPLAQEVEDIEDASRGTSEYEHTDEPLEVEPKSVDDYGNEKPEPKTYTQDEVDERINQAVRDRLARLERNSSSVPSNAQLQQEAPGFKYDANNSDDWQVQLKNFVKQTMLEAHHEQTITQQQRYEEQARAEYEDKFQSGMGKFQDFREVVGSQPITDHMMLASRSMKDPAAFFYAASKRAPAELQRIAGMRDPYAQIAETAKLEERLKQVKPQTRAPRPVSRSSGDVAVPRQEKREPSIEEMIAKDAARRLALQKQRKG